VTYRPVELILVGLVGIAALKTSVLTIGTHNALEWAAITSGRKSHHEPTRRGNIA
jgi:hypothetical protein